MNSEWKTAAKACRTVLLAAWLGSTGISAVSAQEVPGGDPVETEVSPMGYCEYCQPDDPPPQNQPAEAYITSPSGGQQFIAGTPVTISANAYDPDGSLQYVDFRVDQVLIKRDTTAPYQATWTSTVGSHNLAVFPVDNLDFEGFGMGITVNVVPNQVPTVSLTAPASGAKVATGAVVNMTATAADSDGSVQRVEFYVDGAKIGQDTTAPYSLAWTSTLGNHSLIAKAVDNLNVVGTSAAKSITVNVAPSVTLTSPTSGQNLLTGSAVSLTATASDPDGNLSRVDFLVDGAKVGQDTTSPFSFSWLATAGSHTIQAKAYDALSGVTASGTASVAAGSAPTVALTAPTAGQNIVVGTSVSLTASASDVDGDLARVDFLVDGVKIGQDTTAPYSLAWTSTNGTHTVQAKAYDAIGRAGISSVAAIDVSSAPTVSVTSPTAGQTFPTGGSLTLQATATDADGNLSRVDFLVDGVKIGQDTTAPYSFSWSRTYGSHTVQAKAYDAVGFNKASTSVTFEVNDPPTVSLGAPVEAKEYLGGSPVPMSATASDPNGAISRVEFLVDGTVIASDTTAPYTASWTGLLGNRQVKARAVDSLSATAISPGVSINVVNQFTSISRRYVYDNHQRLCKVIEPETGATVMDYDQAGNLAWSASGLDLPSTTSCDRTHASVEARKAYRTYDPRNRVSSLSFPDNLGNTTYDYTPDGLLEILDVNNGVDGYVKSTYTYNARRLLTRELTQFGPYNWIVSHDYNENGHLAEQTYPNGITVAYAPNALGQPTQAGSYATNAKYFPNGALEQFTYGNGIVHTLSQNDRQLPDRSVDAYGTTRYLDDGYDYDGNGNVAAITDGSTLDTPERRNRSMTYDGLNRLRTVVDAPMYGTAGATYAYDVLDNLTRVTIGGAHHRDHDYYYEPGTWRLTNVIDRDTQASVVGLDYDEQGNLKDRNDVDYDFDYGNRLRSVQKISTGSLSTYVYDGHGRRVRDTVDGTEKHSVYTQAGQLVFTNEQRHDLKHWYVYLSGSLVAIRERDQATAAVSVKYQHTDALGTPIVVTDENRIRIGVYREYEPYGQVLNEPVKDGPGYTGHVMDAATGLAYMQQRYYDPSIGRFLSVDPITADPNTGAMFNRYNYANNNPYRFTDPDGRRAADKDPPKEECDSACRKREREQRERERNSDMIIIRSQTKTVGSASTEGAGSTDGIAKATETIIRAFTAATNQEACGGFCPVFGSDGSVIGYSSLVVTQQSHAWCVPSACANGANFFGVNHSHAFRAYIATSHDASRNKNVTAGMMQRPSVVFSGYDKQVSNIYLVLNRGFFNYVDGERRSVP